ncbi:hypothetical protein BUMB_02028c [Candidatus Paraburkholderia calva]|nr:hypothetical protein BUMB_02028c [Candidatus Paraburkholderia calva]
MSTLPAFTRQLLTKLLGSVIRPLNRDCPAPTIRYILDKNDLGDMLGSLIRKMMTLGFFFALLKFSNQWIPMIIDSFTQIGQAASGAGASTTPDGIVSAKDTTLRWAHFRRFKILGRSMPSL